MKYEYLLFDLDGTLTNSERGIKNAICYSLEYFGIKETDLDKLDNFIGPPLTKSYPEYYGFDEEKTEEAVRLYREYYNRQGLFENELYEGIDGLLRDLKQAGYKLLVATSKPEDFTVRILKHFGIYDYFDFVGAATMDEVRKEKEQVVAYTLESMAIADKSKCLMIGDRKYDIVGAKINGIDSLGITYGFGDREELMTAGANYVLDTVEDVRAFFL